VALGAALWALAPRDGATQALSGFDVYRANCGGCHELHDPEDPKRTRDEWHAILDRMVKDRGASLDEREYGAVLNYLDSFNRPKREIRWKAAPAKSRTALFAVADSGKLPAEWVDLTLGGDAPAPWAIQADGAGKSAFLQPLKTVPEGQFPAAIDNTGIVTNGSLSARAQLLSGRGAVGAGVIFGFRDAQNYYGVRLGPKDVVLYEVQGGQRALRARSVSAIPLRQWQTVEVALTGKQVKVTLNGKPLPELAVTLEGYAGGHVGLHTQGDTVAVFDQWRLTIP
jgi:hypothetical protein